MRKVKSRQLPVICKPSTEGKRRSKKVVGEIWEHIHNDKFARSLGIELLQLREGYAKCTMIVGEDMVNAHNIAHGAAIFALADFAFAAACNSYGQTALALEVKINFLVAVRIGSLLTAEAKEESLSTRIGLYHLTVADASDKLVAVAQATAYRKKEWFAGKSKVTRHRPRE